MTIEVGADHRPGLRRVDLDESVGGLERADARERRDSGSGNRLEKLTPVKTRHGLLT
jgi:hypothetical protein